jgi:hypothetical protein
MPSLDMLVPRLIRVAGFLLVGTVEPPNQTQPTAAGRCLENARDGLGFGYCSMPIAEQGGLEGWVAFTLFQRLEDVVD